MSELRQVGLWSNVALSLLIHSSCHTLALPSLWVKKGMFSRCSRCAQVCFLRASVFLFIPLLAGRDCKSGLACQVDMLLRVGSQGKFFISPPRGCKSLWHTYTHHLISDRHLPHLRLWEAAAGMQALRTWNGGGGGLQLTTLGAQREKGFPVGEEAVIPCQFQRTTWQWLACTSHAPEESGDLS